MKRNLLLILALLIASIGIATAQETLTVTGTVTAERDGQPIAGAYVLVNGTTIGTITDANGKFGIKAVPADAKEIIVTFLGYSTASAQVSAQPLEIIMHEDATYLEETIVVAYGTMSKSDFTGSAAQVKGSDIAAGSRESIDKGMLGKISGVRISSDTGDPGSSSSVQIRGVGSISAGTSPLYVVDGMIVGSNDGEFAVGYKSTGLLNTLNPDDIESVTVLKDAAAASLYGSRAANGVILITTKRGKQGKSQVTYSGEVGVSQMANQNAFQMMDGPTFIKYLKDAADNAYNYIDPSYAYGYNGDVWASWVIDPTGNTSTNWTNELFRNALQHNHQVSLSAGNEKTKVYAGLGYNNQEGIVVGSNYERFSGRLNLDHQVNKWLSLGFRQMIAFTNQKGHSDQSTQEQGLGTSSPLGILTQADPTAPAKNEDGSWNENVSWSGSTGNPHVIFESDAQYNKANNFRSMSNFDLNIQFCKQLSLSNNFGYDFIDSKQNVWWSPNSIDGSSLNGLSANYTMQTNDLTNSTVLRFNDTYKDKHHVSALAGFEVSDHRFQYTYASATSYPNDKLPALSVGQTHGTGGSNSRSYMLSVLANANYDYDNKYYVSASFRRDGSSRLGPDNRWANFWSASAAWRLSQEGFMQGLGLFHDFKLKASYGTNGNLPASFYEYKGLYAASGGYGSESAIYWANPENNKLGWEKSQNFNVGFDWNLYGVVDLGVEYYNKYTSSLIFSMPASAVTGFSSYTSNVGNLLNDGVEVEVSSRNFNKKNFTWTTDFNFTWQRSIVKNLPNDGADITYGDGGMYLHREGESMYSFYLPKWKGVNRETGLGEFWVDPEDESKGVTNFYSDAGYTIVGKALPDFVGGMTNTFTFLNGMIDLSFLISYQFGGSLFDYLGYFTYSDGLRSTSMNAAAGAADYWTPENKDAKYPMPIMNNPYRWDRWSSRIIHSTDNIRMREITLGVNIPVKRHIEKLRVYFRSNNPFMIWSATPDIDPDVPLNGYRTVDVPVTRSFIFGVNITL